MSSTAPKVLMYSRPGCHLCDDARVVIERVRARLDFGFLERDIERDDALLRAYLERIPVVMIDGVEVFEYFVQEERLERLLHEAWTRREPQVE